MARVSLRRADRVSSILDRLATTHSVNAASLALEFGVSAATLRRDLQMLEDQRLLSRTHGGALAHDVAYELPVRYRGGRNRDEKRAIAIKAAELLPKGRLTMGLAGGTTTSEVARLIAERVDLTVVTNALNIATELALRPRLKLILTGGVTRSQSYELVGPFAEQTLQALHLEVAIVGVDGISAAAGLTTHDEVEAHTNRTMVSRAKRVIVVADGSKIGRVLLARICALESAHDLVTDSSADPQALNAIRATGITVHVVGASTPESLVAESN
ncbi:MAG: DeoR/GlpR family DNA-binding transcription regulator [Actinomycetes bacterium]